LKYFLHALKYVHYKRLELNKWIKILNTVKNYVTKKGFYSIWISGIIKIVILVTI